MGTVRATMCQPHLLSDTGLRPSKQTNPETKGSSSSVRLFSLAYPHHMHFRKATLTPVFRTIQHLLGTTTQPSLLPKRSLEWFRSGRWKLYSQFNCDNHIPIQFATQLSAPLQPSVLRARESPEQRDRVPPPQARREHGPTTQHISTEPPLRPWPPSLVETFFFCLLFFAAFLWFLKSLATKSVQQLSFCVLTHSWAGGLYR